MAAESVEIEIQATVAGAVDSLKTLEKTATDTASTIDKAFDNIKLAAVIALVTSVGLKIANVFSDAIAKAIESDSAFQKLTSSLKSVGDFSEESAKDFQDFASEIERSSTASDSAVLSQLALAKQMGLTDEEAKKLVQASVDLAAINKGSVEESFTSLAKTLKGTAGTISTTIPEIKKFSKQQLEAGAAIDYVADRLGGSAKEATETYEGALHQLNVEQDDLLKTLGRSITQNPVVIAAILSQRDAVAELGKAVEDSSDSLTGFISTTVKVGVTSKAIGFEIASSILQVARDVYDIFQALSLEVPKNMTKIVAAILSLSDVKVIVQIIGSVFNVVNQAIADFLKNFLELIAAIPGAEAAFNALGVSLEDQIDLLEDTSDALDDFVVNSNDVDKVTKKFTDYADEVERSQLNIVVSNRAFADSLNTTGDKYQDAAAKVLDADSAMADATRKLKKEVEEEGQAAVKAAVAAAKAREKLLALQLEYKDKVKAFTEELTTKTLDDRAKVLQQYEKDNEKITDFDNKRVISAEETERLRNLAYQAFSIKNQEITAKEEEKRNSFLERVLSKETGNIDAIKLARTKDLKELQDNLAAKLVTEDEAIKLREILIAESEKRILAAQTESFKATTDTLTTFTANGLAGLASTAVSTFTDTIIPGFGGAAGKIFEFFTQDTQKFADSLDQLFSVQFIDNFAKNLTTFLTKLPELVTSVLTFLSNNLESIVEDLIAAVIASSPKIVSAFAKAFSDPKFIEDLALGIANGVANGFKDAGTEISDALKKGVNDAIRELGNIKIDLGGLGSGEGGIGGAIGDAIGGIGKAFGFAEGGVVPSGFPNDTFPARLTSGEMILPPALATGLQSLVANDGGNDVQTALLNKIFNLLSQPQEVNTSVNVDGRELASVILNLSRNNARLFA